jgi:GH25 family lysozyme M1 (1,4-beta-N-acetylmuramidase)
VGGAAAPGPDVSHYQGSVNWASVKAAGVGLAIAKATEGSSYVDAQFKANWQVCVRARARARAVCYLSVTCAVIVGQSLHTD